MTPRDQHPVWRRRPAAVGALVLLAAALIAVVLVARQHRDTGAASDADAISGMSDMKGMEGMAGMDMSGDGAVRLTADQVRTFGITFGSVEERMLTADVRTVGIVVTDETRVAQVTPKFSGFVERLFVEETGRTVQRGQPLAAIYSPELLAAQEELLVAQRLESVVGESAVPGVPTASSDLLGAARRRLRLMDVSEAQIQEILRTGRLQRTITLYSPAAGVVTEKNVVQGQAVQAGQTLYTLADLSRVWVEAELREGQLAAVRPGTTADIEVPAYPGRTFKGRVEFVYPTVDPETRTVRARIAVANTTGLLKPGMFATTRLETPTRRALTVPVTALVRTGERTLVFVDMGGGRLAPQDVEVGRVTGDLAEILVGVEPGQRVVTSAQFLLDSESNLAEVMRAMMGQMGMSDMPGMEGMNMPGTDMPGMDMPGMSMPTDKGADVKGAMKGDMQGMPTPKGMPMPPSSAPDRR